MQCSVWWGHKGSIITDSGLALGDLAAGVEERMPHIDCLTQLSFVTWICQLCSTTNTSKKYERTQQGNLLGWMVLQIVQSSSKDYLGLAVKLKHVGECYAAGRQPVRTACTTPPASESTPWSWLKLWFSYSADYFLLKPTRCMKVIDFEH